MGGNQCSSTSVVVLSRSSDAFNERLLPGGPSKGGSGVVPPQYPHKFARLSATVTPDAWSAVGAGRRNKSWLLHELKCSCVLHGHPLYNSGRPLCILRQASQRQKKLQIIMS